MRKDAYKFVVAVPELMDIERLMVEMRGDVAFIEEREGDNFHLFFQVSKHIETKMDKLGRQLISFEKMEKGLPFYSIGHCLNTDVNAKIALRQRKPMILDHIKKVKNASWGKRGSTIKVEQWTM